MQTHKDPFEEKSLMCKTSECKAQGIAADLTCGCAAWGVFIAGEEACEFAEH
jgi:hypothetical protein